MFVYFGPSLKCTARFATCKLPFSNPSWIFQTRAGLKIPRAELSWAKGPLALAKSELSRAELGCITSMHVPTQLLRFRQL